MSFLSVISKSFLSVISKSFLSVISNIKFQSTLLIPDSLMTFVFNLKEITRREPKRRNSSLYQSVNCGKFLILLKTAYAMA